MLFYLLPNNGQLKHDNSNNRKQLVGSLGESNKPTKTECILKQFAPTNLGCGKLEVLFPET